ncbi:reverse transcriptase [Phytophthora megakarya]|uniref:Reverse transcriptase n=1 Tax=Phytophthora megakarya TaxID=4795 RepID=A0A225VU43_9STRA|nr:reverse transcriptase [Phytophthora megakarya]
MRENKLYANLKKCVFCAPEIPVLGCYVSKNGLLRKLRRSVLGQLRRTPLSYDSGGGWRANYLHKYTKDYAKLIQPLSSLLKKDTPWPFHVVFDASDFAIGSALMQFDDEDRERVISNQSRQLKPAERNYPVHDKELLAMHYALIKFRVYLLGEQTFAVYTDHASLRTAMKSPHLSQRMARWLSFFSEYNFVVHYKPGKNNILADTLSRRPVYDPREGLGRPAVVEDEEDSCATCVASGLKLTSVTPELSLREEIAAAYEYDEQYTGILTHLRSPSDASLKALSRATRSHIERHHLDGSFLTYAIDRFDALRVVVPNDNDLRARIIHEYHDTPQYLFCYCELPHRYV